MRRRFLSLAAFLAGAGLIALVAAPDAVAFQKKKNKAKDTDGVITDWGKPKDFAAGKPAHYWIWYDEGTWHLRTTADKKQHRFNGQIEAAGGHFSEIADSKGAKLTPNVDSFVYNKERTAVLIDFKSDTAVDGIDFKVEPFVTSLKFTLAIDGESQPKNISIGKAGDHPKQAVFTLPAHPPEPKK